MEATGPGRPQFRAGGDRTAVLVFLALAWLGVLSGFGTQSYRNLSTVGLGYYHWIVHIHAVVFVGWMVLFTTQVLLIRKGRADLHRKLGFAMLGWMCLMTVVGPATAIVRAKQAFLATGSTPFFAVQFTDLLAFSTLTIAGALLRKNAPAHKRLMLLALFYVTDAGFARLINPLLTLLVPGDPQTSLLGAVVALYGGTNLLVLGLGAYDFAKYRRLHPGWIAGALWIFAVEALAIAGLFSPAWTALTMRMIGQ